MGAVSALISSVTKCSYSSRVIGQFKYPITLWPFPKAAFEAAAERVDSFISVELSMSQMIEDIKLATECKKPVSLCNRCGGMIPGPDEVLAAIRNARKGVSK